MSLSIRLLGFNDNFPKSLHWRQKWKFLQRSYIILMASSCSILVAIYTCCKQHISNMKWKMFDIASGSSIASTSSILSYKHSQSVTQTLLCLQYAKTSTPKQKEGVKLNFNDFQIFIYPDFSVAIHYFTHNPGRMSINSL